MGGTITDQFAALVSRIPNKDALLERDGVCWVGDTFAEWNQISRAAAAALIELGVGEQESVAIFSYSRREWLHADMAILLSRARTVTLYQNLNSDTVHHIITDSKSRVLFVEGPVQLRALFGEHGELSLPDHLLKVVYFQSHQRPPQRPGKPALAELGLAEVVPDKWREHLVSFDEFVARGREVMERHFDELERRIAHVSESDVAKVVYTSGTTGVPKGAVLTHGNLTSVTAGLNATLGICEQDRTLLFLPLAHVYAQLVYHAQMRFGFTIGFARSMLTAVDDAESFGPDFFVSVPRFFEKIHAGILQQVQSGSFVKQQVFNWATSVGEKKSALLLAGKKPTGALTLKDMVASRLVFSKLKKRLGGKLRMMISGGAPLSPEIMAFFHAAGLLIIEGYGMTENASLSHHNRIGEVKFGTVGKPIDNTEVIIADDGEILVRGPSVMKEYLNLPAQTADVIDKGGWLHTGDVGVIDEDGFLTITDRKKDIIVTSGGKNIAPAPIEGALVGERLISQAVVFGNGHKFLVALLSLDEAAATAFLAEKGVGDQGAGLHEHPMLVRAVEAAVAHVNSRLPSYETIKRFAIVPAEFSIDKGEMTPSLKLRKKVIFERYRHLIDELYS